MPRPIFLQMHNCDAGVAIAGVNYTFTDVDAVTYTYGRQNHLMRGANGTNTTGIPTQSGTKTPDTAETTIVSCTRPLYALLLQAFLNRTRVDFWFKDRDTGEGYTFNNSLIRDKPRQLNVGEDDTNFSFTLAVESFDVTEKLDVANDDIEV